jgi:hypothetical protein
MLWSKKNTIRKKILPQNIVFSAEQSAIIGATQSKKNNRHKIVIITDFLGTIMAVESRTPTKNLKTRTIRKMLTNEGPRITLLWVPGNEKADQAAKEARRPEKMADRSRLQKKRPRDGKTETTRWKKGSRTSTEGH